MALTGELSDLSLAELIEFFCNQRKTGRLKLVYPIGPGYFYLQSGSVVHARIGVLRGIEAVYYALTLPNASFSFSPAFEAPEQTINQPWTSVVLEGLRRMDEGIKPSDPFPQEDRMEEWVKPVEESANGHDSVLAQTSDFVQTPESFSGQDAKELGGFLAHTLSASHWTSRPWNLGVVVGAVLLIVTVVGVPWGWYARSKAAKATNQESTVSLQNAVPTASPVVAPEPAADSPIPGESTISPETSDLAAKRQREARAKERAKAQEAAAAVNSAPLSVREQPTTNPTTARSQSSPIAGAKKVTVQVTYDENGRVTQASGADPNALRIARQKRFPAGKAGSATITIPIN